MNSTRNPRRSFVAAGVLRVAATAFVIALAPGAGTADGPATAGEQWGTVQVQAAGSAEAVPDVAILGLSVDIIGTSVSATRDRAAQLTQAVIDVLERHGVEPKDIRTDRFSIDADYRYTNDGRRRLNGYRVVHALAVTYRDLDSVGAVIDAVSRAGGDELAFGYIAFSHADRELGPLLVISEEVSVPDYGPYRTFSAGDVPMRAEAADTPISVGRDTLSVTVSGVFALR